MTFRMEDTVCLTFFFFLCWEFGPRTGVHVGACGFGASRDCHDFDRMYPTATLPLPLSFSFSCRVFFQVPMPRAALKDLANSRGLARAAAEAKIGGSDDQLDRATVSNDCDEVDGVVLWADWPFSCVRLRGEPATVRRAVSVRVRVREMEKISQRELEKKKVANG